MQDEKFLGQTRNQGPFPSPSEPVPSERTGGNTQDYLERMFEEAQEAIVIADTQGHVLKVNREFTRLFGYTKQDVQGLHIDQLVAPKDDPSEALFITQRAIRGEKVRLEAVRRRKDGSEISVSILAFPIVINGRPEAICGIYRDIVEQKKLREILEASERRFQDIVLTTPDWIWEIDREFRYTFASGRVKQLLGYESSEVIGKTPFDLMPQEEAKSMRSAFQKAITERSPIVNFEKWMLTKEGQRVLLLTNGVPIHDTKDEFLGFRGVDRLIGGQAHPEEATKQGEAKYRMIFESLHDVYYRTDNQGVIVEISPSVYNQAGYRPEEVIGRPVTDFYLNPEDRDALMAQIKEKGSINDYELVLLAKDGRRIFCSLNARTVCDSSGNLVGVEGVLR
ncbi:MAG: PAS domain S-box protein, partial [Candidatus Aminicenantales bacterium]